MPFFFFTLYRHYIPIKRTYYGTIYIQKSPVKRYLSTANALHKHMANFKNSDRQSVYVLFQSS